MNKSILFFGIILCFFGSSGQDATMILKQSFEKCQSIRNGYYEMRKSMKHLTEKDTVSNLFYCNFRKLSNDSIFSSAFHYKFYTNNVYSGNVLYTGEDFVRTFANDSSAIIMSKYLWAKEIKSYSHNYTFYSPFTNKMSAPLPLDSDFFDGKHIFKFIGVEFVNGLFCNHIQVNETPDNESKESMKVLRQEYHYWISKEDFIPIRYSISIDLLMNSDLMNQYEVYSLYKYELNNMKDDNVLRLSSIPSYFKLKDFLPYKSPDPLPIDTIAPDWELFSISDEKIGLSSQRGYLVLIDFFYKSCYPCIQSLPVLQSLYDKYKDRGFKIIGIDPYDSREDDIADFLLRQGVTYTILLGGKDVAKNYHVSGYPTMYLIDKRGNVIFRQIGYGKDFDGKLEDVIRRNL